MKMAYGRVMVDDCQLMFDDVSSVDIIINLSSMRMVVIVVKFFMSMVIVMMVAVMVVLIVVALVLLLLMKTCGTNTKSP